MRKKKFEKLTPIGLTKKESKVLSQLAEKALMSYADVKFYSSPVIRAFEIIHDVATEASK